MKFKSLPINEILLEHSHTHSFMLLSLAVFAQLNSCTRGFTKFFTKTNLFKVQNIYFGPLQKKFADSCYRGIKCAIHKWTHHPHDFCWIFLWVRTLNSQAQNL